MPLRLRYLKWNPVGSLYRRHGFSIIDETEIHFSWSGHLAELSSAHEGEFRIITSMERHRAYAVKPALKQLAAGSPLLANTDR